MNADPKKVKLLIVEDEIILAKDIAARLEAYEVVGIAASAEKAITLIEANADIDIILLDIVLKGDRDGIELARIINEHYQIPFVYLTSHADNHLFSRAMSTKPYGYLLKPFNDLNVRAALRIALNNVADKKPENQAPKIVEVTNPPKERNALTINDSLFLKKDYYFERVPIAEISFLEASGSYTTINTRSGRFVYSTVLKKIEEQLPKDRFQRVHRSFVVNTNAVTKIEGKLLHVNQTKIKVSKSYEEAVFDRFKRI